MTTLEAAPKVDTKPLSPFIMPFEPNMWVPFIHAEVDGKNIIRAGGTTVHIQLALSLDKELQANGRSFNYDLIKGSGFIKVLPAEGLAIYKCGGCTFPDANPDIVRKILSENIPGVQVMSTDEENTQTIKAG